MCIMGTFAIILISSLVGALIGGLVTALVMQQRRQALQSRVDILESQLKSEAAQAQALMQAKEQHHKEAMQAQQAQFDETMAKISAQMKVATDEMLKQRQK